MFKKNWNGVEFIEKNYVCFFLHLPLPLQQTFYRTMQCRQARCFPTVDRATVLFRSADGMTAACSQILASVSSGGSSDLVFT